MQYNNFKNIRVTIGEPSYEVRIGLKSVLSGAGFVRGHIRDTDKISEIREAIVNDQADLFVCDAQLPDGGFDSLVRQVRHHELGDNPFINVITLTSTADKQTIMTSVNSGTDVILVKPISPRKIMERIENMIHERKPFVVTDDYVGPDRRTEHRPGTMEIPQFEVPNPLKARIEDEADDYLLRAEINAMAKALNEQKIERHAYRIVYLLGKLVPNYTEGKIDESVTAELDRLRLVLNDINRRVAGSRFADWNEVCRALVNVVGRIAKTPMTPNAKDLESLRNLAEIFKSRFNPVESMAQVAR